MYPENAYKKMKNVLVGILSITSIAFIGLMILWSPQDSYAQLNSSTINSNNSGIGVPAENERGVTFGAYSSFVNDINSVVESNTSNSNSNNFTESATADKPKFDILTIEEILIQNTSMSIPAPVRHPGQPSHEVVFALPLRDDGKVWSGTVTFTASKPIEVEVLHTYAPLETPDSVHGEPYHAVLPGNKSIAITHLRHLVDIPIEINGTGMSSGTLDFTGNALVFHKTSGEPFTVTYTIDALAKELTRIG